MVQWGRFVAGSEGRKNGKIKRSRIRKKSARELSSEQSHRVHKGDRGPRPLTARHNFLLNEDITRNLEKKIKTVAMQSDV